MNGARCRQSSRQAGHASPPGEVGEGSVEAAEKKLRENRECGKMNVGEHASTRIDAFAIKGLIRLLQISTAVMQFVGDFSK